MDFSANEPVIEPAPAQVNSVTRASAPMTEEEHYACKMFKDSVRNVRAIMEPISYLTMQQESLNPDIKMMLLLNEVTMMAALAKSVAAYYVEDCYKDIKTPGIDMRALHEDFRRDLNNFTEQFMTSVQSLMVHAQRNHRIGGSPSTDQ